MGNLLHGDLGTYSAQRRPVSDRISTALPVTMQLTFFGLLLGTIVSFTLGVIAALYRDGWPDQLIRLLSIAGLATPSFWLAVLLILVFSSYLHMLPASGPLPSPSKDFVGYLARMIMPAVSLAVPLTGQMTRIVRTAMVEELDRDYVRTAKGSGLPKGVIIARNVLRNALITPVTTLGMKIGYLMGGAVVIEVIFNLPGMGMAILDGVSGNEPMLVMGVVIVVALSFIVINIVVDMLYLLINPRIRSV
jgi:peptide/nickel transport system permease protein